MSNARELAELGGSYGTGGFVGMKNRLINGDMRIDQRNAGASVTPNNNYTLDRWFSLNSQTSKFTVQQSTTVPTGFKNSAVITSSSSYSVGSGDYFTFSQRVEGLNWYDLGWGAAGALSVTLSFWVRSSLTGTFGGAVRNDAGNRSYPFTYTISSANTWEQKSVTIAGDTSGTWLTTNGTGIELDFGLGAGSTYSGTASAWASANYVSATGAVSVVGTSGATFYITGVQLEKGSTATSFDYRPYGAELALCQRYCWTWSSVDNQYSPFGLGRGINTTSVQVPTLNPVQMRASPSVSYSAGSTFGVANNLACSAVSAGSPTRFGFNSTFTTTGVAANSAYVIESSNTTSAYVIASAEL